jgi:hypothetical protein
MDGLPLNQLLLAPFFAAQESQLAISMSSLKFLSDQGLDASGNLKTVKVTSSYLDTTTNPGTSTPADISFNIPLISLINMPCLYMKKVNMDFNIKISSQNSDSKSRSNTFGGSAGAQASYFGIGGSISANFQTTGSNASSNANSTESQYKIHIEAENEKPLGLLMLLDYINTNRGGILPDLSQGPVKTLKDFTNGV